MAKSHFSGGRPKLAASLDYEINLKAEVEIMALHDKLDRIRLERLEGILAAQSTRIEAIAQSVGLGPAKSRAPDGSREVLGTDVPVDPSPAL